MITPEEIKKLAHLARIDVTEEEVAGYAKDFEAILGYVDQLNNVSVPDMDTAEIQAYGAREDTNPHEPGTYVKGMLADAPASQDGFYKMPKIL